MRPQHQTEVIALDEPQELGEGGSRGSRQRREDSRSTGPLDVLQPRARPRRDAPAPSSFGRIPVFVHGDRGSQAHRCSRRAVPPPPVPSRSAHRDEPTQHGFDRGRVGRTHVGHQGEAAATHIAIVHVGKGRSVKRSPCRLRERANATRLRRCRGRCRPNWRAAAFVRQRAYWTRLSSGPPEPGRRRMLSPWDPH